MGSFNFNISFWSAFSLENDAHFKAGPPAWRVSDYSLRGREFPCWQQKRKQHVCIQTETNLITLGLG